MKIWASHPKLKEGELLSSWLVRLAAAGGMTAKEFCQSALSLKKPNLRAFDRTPEDSLLHALSEGSQTPIDVLSNASLLPEDGYVLSLQGQGEENWIIPALTTVSRINQYTTGMAFCPACFQDDHAPYFRKSWHFAFSPLCPIHRLPLRNACPHCKAPYTHLQPGARRNADLSLPIRTCWSCGEDLGQAATNSPWGVDFVTQALNTQQYVQEGISRGFFHVVGQGDIHSLAYMNTLHCVLNSLTKGNRSSELIDYVGNRTGVSYETLRAPRKWFDRQEFELKPAEDRAALLCLAIWLMDDWPNRLVTYINHSNLSYHAFFKSIDVPFWLETSLHPFFASTIPSTPSTDEIKNATQVLRMRMKRPVTSGEVREFMSTGNQADHTDKRQAGRNAAKAWHQRFSMQWQAARETERRSRLAKVIQWSQSRKFLIKISSPPSHKEIEAPSHEPDNADPQQLDEDGSS